MELGIRNIRDWRCKAKKQKLRRQRGRCATLIGNRGQWKVRRQLDWGSEGGEERDEEKNDPNRQIVEIPRVT